MKLLASSHTPRPRARCFEAVDLTFCLLLFMTLMEKIDGYQRPYEGSPDDFSTISGALGVVTAFHFKLLLEKSCLLFFFFFFN